MTDDPQTTKDDPKTTKDDSFAAKVNAALRNQFGGHAVESAPSAEEAKPTP